jgi:hypothetical protein
VIPRDWRKRKVLKGKESCALVVHTIILATWEAKMGRIVVKASLDKKFVRLHLNQQLGTVVCICHLKLCGRS